MTIGNVRLAFKTHLDVGFTAYAGEVAQVDFDDFIPGIRLLLLLAGLHSIDPAKMQNHPTSDGYCSLRIQEIL